MKAEQKRQQEEKKNKEEGIKTWHKGFPLLLSYPLSRPLGKVLYTG